MLCIDSVTKATKNIESEIIVVDNNSKDESCDLVNAHFPEVILIKNEENTGFSKGNNIGAAKAKGEFLCILNPDTIVPEDCFTRLLEYHLQLRNPGAIGVQLIDGSGEFLDESKRNIPTPKIAMKKLMGNYDSYYNLNLNENDCGPTDILVGAFMFMKTDLFKKIEGFDETYFMYGEDIDLSYRILKAGFQNYFFGKTKVLHFKGESTVKDQVYLNRFFNAIYIFYKKHFKTYKTLYQLVKLSLKFTMALERTRLNALKVTNHHYDKIQLISTDGCLKTSIKNNFNSEVSMEPKMTSKITNTLIVLDADSMQYKECIKTIASFKSKTNAFRIKPRSFKLIIGSESKYVKGEVIHLS